MEVAGEIIFRPPRFGSSGRFALYFAAPNAEWLFEMTGALPPLTLYVHIPWCLRKCPYCDFNSHQIHTELPQIQYAVVLLADLEDETTRVGQRPVESVFFGGGTPSLLSGATMRTLMQGIAERLNLSADCEVSMEVNPGAAEMGDLAEYKAAGINRLSIGIQSFSDRRLARIGRVHDAAQAWRAIAAARTAGFENLNLDLMFGLPGQTTADALEDLRLAMSSGASHISRYELTIEPNTYFYRHPPSRPDDESRFEMHARGNEALAAFGFQRYEISAFAKPHFPCRHNINYWRFGDYIGIGAGAHGKLTRARPHSVCRTVKQKHPSRYMECTGPERVMSSSHPRGGGLRSEFLLNGLRLTEGFTAELYESRTNLDYEDLACAVQECVDRGLLSNREGRVRTTQQGMWYLNDVLAALAEY